MHAVMMFMHVHFARNVMARCSVVHVTHEMQMAAGFGVEKHNMFLSYNILLSYNFIL